MIFSKREYLLQAYGFLQAEELNTTIGKKCNITQILLHLEASPFRIRVFRESAANPRLIFT